MRFPKKIKKRAKRYIDVSQRLQTELLVVAFVIFSEMLLMDSFCDFKMNLVENDGTWIVLINFFLLSVNLPLSFCCMLFWMLFCWLLFCRWVGLKVLKFEVLMFLTSILSVEIFESFTSNSSVDWNITEQITRVCILMQVLIDCSFSLFEFWTTNFEFSFFTMVFADMTETQKKQVRRQCLYVFIIGASRNVWRKSGFLLSFL